MTDDRGFERRQTWVMGVALLLVFAFVGTAFERLNAQAHNAQVATYASCMARNANVEHLNRLFAGLQKIESNNQFVNAQVRAQRVRLYSEAQFVLPNCGAKP